MDYRLTAAYQQIYHNNKEGWNVSTLTNAYKDVVTLNEAILGPASISSLPGYYEKINELLNNTPVPPFPVMFKNQQKDFYADPGQQIVYSKLNPKAAVDTLLNGKIDNVPVQIKVRHIVKTPAIKGKSFGNRGQILEGVLGAALFARLIARPNQSIDKQDILNVISELSENSINKSQSIKTLIKRVEGKEGVTDTFKLIVKLKELPMQSFLDINTVQLLISDNQLQGIASYANDTAPRYAKHFELNKKYDYVEIISDGVSMEATSKVDVILKANGSILKRYVLSVKEGDTKIIGQKGSGGERAGRQKQYEILESLWKDFGINISGIQNTFVNSVSVQAAYEVGYEEASRQLANAFEQNYDEAVQSLVKGILKYGALNTPHLRLAQFTEKGYYVLNFQRLIEAVHSKHIKLNVNFSNKTRPIITIFDENSETPFLTFRVFRTSGGYIRNYIEKEELLINLTKVSK